MAKNILIIDDEELVTESIKRLLKKEGYNVTVACNSKEAMEYIQTNDFNLIVSDIRMPEIDGVEIIKNIREYLQQKNKKPIPEILITGYSSDETFKQVQKLKVADYLYKPFDIHDFLAIVKKNLS
ncbi:MAG: response regulator [Candidatus Omnitrophica bacterium]|nr:response regulator [Candidatus Omnitrophota bacterium]